MSAEWWERKGCSPHSHFDRIFEIWRGCVGVGQPQLLNLSLRCRFRTKWLCPNNTDAVPGNMNVFATDHPLSYSHQGETEKALAAVLAVALCPFVLWFLWLVDGIANQESPDGSPDDSFWLIIPVGLIACLVVALVAVVLYRLTRCLCGYFRRPRRAS
jgi:hypothetical protein